MLLMTQLNYDLFYMMYFQGYFAIRFTKELDGPALSVTLLEIIKAH